MDDVVAAAAAVRYDPRRDPLLLDTRDDFSPYFRSAKNDAS